MLRSPKCLRDFPEIAFFSNPVCPETMHTERATIALQCLLASIKKKPFIEERKSEFVKRTVDWITESKHRMIRLAYGAETPAALVQRDYVISVTPPKACREIHN